MEEGRAHHTNGYRREPLSKAAQWTGPKGSSLPPDAQTIKTEGLGGEMAAEKCRGSLVCCHLTYCDSVIGQEALHSAGTILDKQGLAQVLEGEGLGRVKAVVVFCNKDPN